MSTFHWILPRALGGAEELRGERLLFMGVCHSMCGGKKQGKIYIDITMKPPT
jgi:hypothetical protein